MKQYYITKRSVNLLYSLIDKKRIYFYYNIFIVNDNYTFRLTINDQVYQQTRISNIYI